MVIDIEGHFDARKGCRQRTPVRTMLLAYNRRSVEVAFASSPAARFARLLKPEQQLNFGKSLSLPAEAVALHLLDDLDQAGILDVTRQVHRLQRVRIVRKLVNAV
jgi:hypothetical protein